MGLRKEYIDFILNQIPDNDTNFHTRMLELGSQEIRDPELHSGFLTGQDYFMSIGLLHMSFDINGNHGAIPLDLDLPINGFQDMFDIVTNSGTSICVGVNGSNCYDNIYPMCKPGGVIIHILPLVGSEWHANHFVNRKFFKGHCKKYNCKVIEYQEIDGIHGKLAMVALRKNREKSE